MNGNLKKYYQYLKNAGADTPDTIEIFAETLSNEGNAKKYYEYLKNNGFDTPDTYDIFSETLGLKKKVSSEVSATPVQESSTQPSPLEPTKERETTVMGDLLRSLKAGTMRTLGGITGIPIFINRTVGGVTIKPIAKAMGATEEEANKLIDYAGVLPTWTGTALDDERVQQQFIKWAEKTEKKMYPIMGTFEENIKEKDWAELGEMVGRGVMQTLPYLAMTLSTAGGGTAATLGTIGATSASQQYGELKGEKESTRKLNAWLYGGFEAAGELVTAGLARGVGRAFKAGKTGQINQNFVKGLSKELAKSFGLESSSEAVTQIGQNFTDIVTGIDPDKSILSDVLYAGVVGGVVGVGLGGANVGAQVLGRALAQDAETEQVQDNFSEQNNLINEIKSTDVDPTKEALQSRLMNLKYEADKIMDKNFELAKTLSPEQKEKVAGLYTTWNKLQEKLDTERLTEEEVTSTEKTIEGIKNEIEGVRDSQIAKLGEIKEEEVKYKIGDKKFKTKEEVEAWLDKNYIKRGLDPVWNEPTEKIIDAWAEKNQELIEKRFLEQTQETILDKIKKEEETEDAERIRKEDKEIAEEGAPELEQQEVDRDRIQDYEQVGETAPEEVEIYHTAEEIEDKPVFGKDNPHVGFVSQGASTGYRGRKLTIDEVPDILYHVTTSLPLIEKSGKLIAGEKGGLGGGQMRGVSFTTDKTSANRMVDVLKQAIGLMNAKTDAEVKSILEEMAENDSKIVGRKINNQIKYWNTRRKRKESLNDTKSMVLMSYLQEAEKISNKLINPILFGVKNLKGKNPADVGIVEIKKENIPQKAGIVEGTDKFLNEIRVLSEIPLKPKEAISGTLAEEKGEVPPPPQKPLKTAEKAPREEKPLGAQERILSQYETEQQQIVSDVVDKNKEFYTVLSGEQAITNARKFIKDRGIEGATRELEKPIPSSEEAPTRTVARLVLLDNYSRILGDEGRTKADRDNAYNVINKLQEMVAKESNKWGQANAHLHLWKSMQPSGQLEFVKRKINEFNEKKLNTRVKGTNKTAGQLLDLMYETLSEENKKIIDDILEGKNIADLISKEPRKERIPPKRRTIAKEKIKQEQDYRKKLLDDYKKSKGGTLLAGAPITPEQIELGGNLIASYVREGYYRLVDIVEQLKKDLASVNINVDDDQVNEILNKEKEEGETYRDYITKQTEKTGLREEMKSQRLRIQDVVKRHWSEREELGRSLADKLVDDAWLTPEEAKRISDAITKEYNKKIVERLASNKDLAKLLGTQKIPREGKKKTYMSKFLEMINLRPLQKEGYRELFAEKFGLVPEMTAEQGKGVLRLAGVLQQMSNKGWFTRDATIDLAKYVYELQPKSRRSEFAETWIALAYAHMLSGIPTSILNMWSAGTNIVSKPLRNMTDVSKYLRAIKKKGEGKSTGGELYNPIGQMFWVALHDGILKGAVDATEVYVNGDVGSKYVEEISQQGQFKSQQLERNKYGKSMRFKPLILEINGEKVNFGNPLNLEKYVARNLAAQDRLMFNTAFELELMDIIRGNLALKGLRGKELNNKTLEIYKGRHLNEGDIAEQINQEAKKYYKLTGKTLTQRQANIRYREITLEKLIEDGYITEEQKREAEMLARSNVFTDDRFGAIGTLANSIGRLSNSKPAAGLILKPFVPFTKVVGNVSEYMLDYTPFYGFMRANGWSVTGLIKRMSGSEKMQTAQMGEKGSRAYYEQLSRAWFGTISFAILAMAGIGNDEDDWFQITGGYDEELMRGKTGRQNVTPRYSVRFGDFDISYLNVPILAVPLAMIGNVNDALHAGVPEDEVMDRLTMALLATSALKTVTMVKDMSFVQGVKDFTDMLGGLLSFDDKEIKAIGKTMMKNYLGFAMRPLPHNTAIVQQTWKIFDPASYSQKDIKGILGYASGLQHFVNYPTVDQLGDDVKTYPGETLMPYTHWLNIKGKDERWKFLVNNNAIPTKIRNRAMAIETKDGVDRRPLEADEFHDYTKKAGQIFSDKLIEYMNDKELVKDRADDRSTKYDSRGEEVITTGIQDDVLELYNLSREEASNQLFRWYDFKKNNPKGFALLIRNDALQSPADFLEVNFGEGDVPLSKEELHRFNKKAMEFYYESVVDYLSEKPDQEEVNETTGENIYQSVLKKLWTKAKAGAKGEITEELEAKK